MNDMHIGAFFCPGAQKKNPALPNAGITPREGIRTFRGC